MNWFRKQILIFIRCIFFFSYSFHMISRLSATSPIYESINVNAVAHSDGDPRNKLNKLKRQDAIDDKKRNPDYGRDVRAFLERCIPPPPSEPPPSDEDSETVLSPLEFSSETLEKLNSLYSLYKGNRSICNKNDETADVEYRMPEFNACSSRFLRGSSKAMSMCSSVVSVLTYIQILNLSTFCVNIYQRVCVCVLFFFFSMSKTIVCPFQNTMIMRQERRTSHLIKLLRKIQATNRKKLLHKMTNFTFD